MSGIVDNSEWDEILRILEDFDDEVMVANYLQQITSLNKELGELILRSDNSLEDEEWKRQCDEKKRQIDKLIADIRSQR